MSRAETLAQLQAGSITIEGVLDGWTKPVAAIEAAREADQITGGAQIDVLDLGDDA